LYKDNTFLLCQLIYCGLYNTAGSTPTDRQFAPDDEPLGGPDPGGDPVDPAIPVSKGLNPMFVIALVYACWKMVLLKKNQDKDKK